ncbi:hypothetical protein F933_03329 [Acinetobacter beijerinckii CIP 110307]|uniref:Uncharacterized protein n=1 Tax=Acinetobacter beijerinckii CIP 110307 TaxID=1217648 RepID=N9DXH1_9GAMM|nr:hypothetical protein F933_03329 [Acinetobacter beijerinckii CIP 110307]
MCREQLISRVDDFNRGDLIRLAIMVNGSYLKGVNDASAQL